MLAVHSTVNYRTFVVYLRKWCPTPKSKMPNIPPCCRTSPVGRMAALTASASQVKLRHRARVKTLPSEASVGTIEPGTRGYPMLGGIHQILRAGARGFPTPGQVDDVTVRFLVADLVAQGLSSSRREDGDGQGIDLTRSGRNASGRSVRAVQFLVVRVADQYVLPEDPTSALAVAAVAAIGWRAPVLVTTLFAWDLAWNEDNVVGGG